MKLSDKLQMALNEQINLEFESAYAYFGMAAYFDHTAFTGFASWMKLQGKEELGHANRFYGYVVDRGGKVQLLAVGAPKSDYASPLEVFRASLGHERKVSESICNLYELAMAEKDYPTLSFLKWFLDEQVEEEKTVTGFIDKLEWVGDNRNGLYQIDKLAGKRSVAET